jgi:hypothetical protein
MVYKDHCILIAGMVITSNHVSRDMGVQRSISLSLDLYEQIFIKILVILTIHALKVFQCKKKESST